MYKHQQDLIDLDPSKFLLSWECGTGKSRAVIELCKLKEPILVICPKSLVDNWANEIKQWNGIGFQVITKEGFRKLYKTLPRYNTIICDECQYFLGIKSQMSKALIAYIKVRQPKHTYLLTATPYMSTPWNIYTLAKILGFTWSYPTFRQKFFYEVKMGPRTVPIIKKGIEPAMAKLVQRLGSTVRMDECVDIPEQTFETEYFELTAEQKTAIKNLTDFLPIVKFTKVHQICGGTLKSDGYVPTAHYKAEKIERLTDLVNSVKKVAVICRYNAEIDYLGEIIGKTKKVFKITGREPERQKTVDEINASEECCVFISGGCSEGYNLPTIPMMIFYSYDFSLKNYIQVLGRIQRINAIKKNVYISLIVKGTIDEDIYKCILSKKNFDVEIYAKERSSCND
jgi:superfamily II DNA or RNA helicase